MQNMTETIEIEECVEVCGEFLNVTIIGDIETEDCSFSYEAGADRGVYRGIRHTIDRIYFDENIFSDDQNDAIGWFIHENYDYLRRRAESQLRLLFLTPKVTKDENHDRV